MEGEKHGHPRSLEDKTLPQLRELLDRQEKLAINQKLLNKLPDKGHKMLQYLDTLRHVVSERQRLETSSGRVPALSSSTEVPDQEAYQTVQRVMQAGTPSVSNDQSTQEDSIGVQDRAGDKLGGGEATDSDTAADLSQYLESLTVSELAAPRMSSGEKVVLAPGDEGNVETRFQNSYETVMKRSAEDGTKRAPFKPNSSLKISNIDDLPEAYKLKSKTSAQVTPPEIVPQEEASKKTAGLKEQRPAEDSAVQGPAYKFAGAKEISIRDSIGLQKQQREHLEKLKSVHAAEKLAERLNIKTAVYNPTTVDMDYRSSDMTSDAHTYDSDDIPDEEDNILS